MYVAGTLLLKQGDLVYNSCPLWDREGKLVGIYNKNMLYEPEMDNGESLRHRTAGLPHRLRQGGHYDLLRQLASGGRAAVGLQGRGAGALSQRGLLHAVDARPRGGQRDCDCGLQRKSLRRVGQRRQPGRRRRSGRYAERAEPRLWPSRRTPLRTPSSSPWTSPKKSSPHYWGGPMLSAPGGHRVRATAPYYLEDEISREAQAVVGRAVSRSSDFRFEMSKCRRPDLSAARGHPDASAARLHQHRTRGPGRSGSTKKPFSIGSGCERHSSRQGASLSMNSCRKKLGTVAMT